MNILYIGEPHSIHDIKWMSFFSAQKDFKIFLVSERHNMDDLTRDTERLADMNIHYLGSISSFSIRKGVDTFKTIRHLRKMIRNNHIELVHFLFATPYSLWGLFLRIPYIITTRGSDVLVVLPYLLRSGQEGSVRNKILYRLFEKAFEKAAAITSTSLAQVDMIRHLFKETPDSVLIRTGVPVDIIQDTAPSVKLSSKDIIFSPRYFSPVYGTELQLQAISKLSDEWIEKLHFIFVKGGSNNTDYALSLERTLKNIGETRGLSYEVLDEVSQVEMFGIYKSAKLTLLTPRSDGTPNSALEAMAAGCPLVVPDLPYDEQLFNENTCHILKGRDPQALADLIQYILKEDVSKITAHAMETVRMYGNREIEMTRLRGLYGQLYHQYYGGSMG